MLSMTNIINEHNKRIINPPKDNISRTLNYIKRNSKCKYHTKQCKFEKKVIMTLVKQHLSSDIRTTKKHSIASNTKEIQNYQTNIKT